jgi:Fe-S cluster assembly iron-binding protein IscA
MIQLTERAAVAIATILALRDAAPGEGLKLVPDEAGGMDLTVGAPAADDEVVRRGGDPLLIVDRRLAPTLEGALLDLAELDSAVEGPRFTLVRPGRR